MALPLAVPLAAAAIQTGIGVGQAVGGTINKQKAEREREAAISALEGIDYADFNQAYYEELNRRASLGLPEEQRIYAETMAERAAGAGLAVGEDRRAGLVGIGRSQASLSDAYSNIAMADIAMREQNAQAMLAEMSKRGEATYGEEMQMGQLDLALAEQARQEGLSMQQAGIQGAMTGLGVIATMKSGGRGLENLYGDVTTPPTATPPTATLPTDTPPTVSLGYTPPQSLSLSQNNSPFAYGSGLTYTPGMSNRTNLSPAFGTFTPSGIGQ